jgi:hypothetical protein
MAGAVSRATPALFPLLMRPPDAVGSPEIKEMNDSGPGRPRGTGTGCDLLWPGIGDLSGRSLAGGRGDPVCWVAQLFRDVRSMLCHSSSRRTCCEL